MNFFTGRSSELRHYEGKSPLFIGVHSVTSLTDVSLDSPQFSERSLARSARHKCLVRTTGWIMIIFREVVSVFDANNKVQSYNSAAIAWGALAKPLYATGTRYGVSA